MQVRVAKNAGFCAGVTRAVRMAEDSLLDNGQWYTLGPLVHNNAVVQYFQQKGIHSLDKLADIDNKDAGLIIRSHGATPQIIEEARQMGIQIKDATCLLVKKVHEIVATLQRDNYDIVIFGDQSHPEVQAILGWCDNNAIVINGLEEVGKVQSTSKLALVSQTTRDENEFLAVAAALMKKAKELRVFNTICSATRERQQSARDLCGDVDLMLVIGDLNSSNTTTLARECKKMGVETRLVQSAADLELDWFREVSRVGITAGASAPDWIIKEVLDKMTEFDEMGNQEENREEGQVENQEATGHEESFAKMEAEMADFASPNKGDVIKGTVIQVLDDEVMVDVGGKSEGIIPLREIAMNEVTSARELLKVGDQIEVLVLKWDDDGNILLSKKKVDAQKILDRLEDDYKAGKTVKGIVTGSVKGGLLVDMGIVAFLPASHIDNVYIKNLDEYIGQELEFKIIEFNRNKRRGSQIVLSRKELIAEEKARLKQEFWENIQEGQTLTGRIKRIVDYGAFIDLGGYEGLLHVSEIDHVRIDHPSDIIHEGDEIEVYVMGVDRDKERVSLSRKKLLKSPWSLIIEQYKEGDIIEGTVVRLTPFGAFVELAPGVDGLVHISQLANHRVERPADVVAVGQIIKAKILNINNEDKKIGLSIREAQTETEQNEVDEFLRNQPEE